MISEILKFPADPRDFIEIMMRGHIRCSRLGSAQDKSCKKRAGLSLKVYKIDRLNSPYGARAVRKVNSAGSVTRLCQLRPMSRQVSLWERLFCFYLVHVWLQSSTYTQFVRARSTSDTSKRQMNSTTSARQTENNEPLGYFPRVVWKFIYWIIKFPRVSIQRSGFFWEICHDICMTMTEEFIKG